MVSPVAATLSVRVKLVTCHKILARETQKKRLEIEFLTLGGWEHF
jgi:hypothetical protein